MSNTMEDSKIKKVKALIQKFDGEMDLVISETKKVYPDLLNEQIDKLIDKSFSILVKEFEESR